MRAAASGHTAKYGSYTMMDLKSSKVLDMQLVQSNEVKNSNAMELEGLKRSLEFLKEEGISIKTLTTDRHLGVKKFMREEQKDVAHWFDVWHVAKGIKKKILAKGKRKDCRIPADWAKSISNHIYYTASTSQCNADLVKEKWLSVVRHVADVHTGHGKLFPSCEHDAITDRNWIKKGSKPQKELELIVANKILLKDVGQLSPAEQTSNLEVYHKVVIFFAPKSVHFSFAAMEARLLLAALHFNENSNRAQAVTKDGNSQWSVSYPKARQGEAVLKAIKVPVSYDYIQKLSVEVLELCDQYPSYTKAQKLVDQRSFPPPITASFEKPTKEVLVGAFMSRFNLKP